MNVHFITPTWELVQLQLNAANNVCPLTNQRPEMSVRYQIRLGVEDLALES